MPALKINIPAAISQHFSAMCCYHAAAAENTGRLPRHKNTAVFLSEQRWLRLSAPSSESGLWDWQPAVLHLFNIWFNWSELYTQLCTLIYRVWTLFFSLTNKKNEKENMQKTAGCGCYKQNFPWVCMCVCECDFLWPTWFLLIRWSSFWEIYNRALARSVTGSSISVWNH